jgi:hypothetical protein
VLQVLEYLRAKVTDAVVVGGARRDVVSAEMRAHVDQVVEMVSNLQIHARTALDRQSKLAVAGVDDAEEFSWDARRLPTPRAIGEFSELSVKAVSSARASAWTHKHEHSKLTGLLIPTCHAVPHLVAFRSREVLCACSMCMRTHLRGCMRLSPCRPPECRELLAQ